MENPIKTDDLGVPKILETPIYIYIYTLCFILFIPLSVKKQEIIEPSSPVLTCENSAIENLWFAIEKWRENLLFLLPTSLRTLTSSKKRS